MTENQTPPEAQTEVVNPDEGQAAEPMYGAEDIQAALGESGQRALASAYFAAYTRDSANVGLTKSQADEMITAIKNNQPWPPPPEAQPLEQSETPSGQPVEQPAEQQPSETGGA